ncbi:MAG: hypothetical protein LBT46_01285 [Planctomycetaceae bacterium]|nr:hypothetical protein [Planctomycetaceae bacterium]
MKFIREDDALFAKVKKAVERASDVHKSKSLMKTIHSKDITFRYFHDRVKGVKTFRGWHR